MASYKWPAWMPRPQTDSYSFQIIDRRISTETEAGYIVRQQFDTDECEAECSLILDRRQSKWFESFESALLRQGASWFYFPLWSGGEISYHAVRFKTRPKFSAMGLYTKYTFSLYVSKRNILDKYAAELIYEVGFDADFGDIPDRLHEILHIESPGLTVFPSGGIYA